VQIPDAAPLTVPDNHRNHHQIDILVKHGGQVAGAHFRGVPPDRCSRLAGLGGAGLLRTRHCPKQEEERKYRPHSET